MDNEQAIHASFNEFLQSHSLHAAPVSADAPLISNQDVYMNIALIKQYHETMPKNEAKKLALEYLERLDLVRIAHKRNSALTAEEKFFVMLLRAAMVREAVLLIDQPLKMIPHLKDFQLVAEALKRIDDLYFHCHIFDYQWMKDKYGGLCP